MIDLADLTTTSVRALVVALLGSLVLSFLVPVTAAAACGTGLPLDQEVEVMRGQGPVVFKGLVLQRIGHTSLVEIKAVWHGQVPSRLVTVSSCSTTECWGGDPMPGHSYLFHGLTNGPFYGLPWCTSPADVDSKLTFPFGPPNAPPAPSLVDVLVVAGFAFATAWWAVVLLALSIVATLRVRTWWIRN